MMLTVHGLPPNTKYYHIKALIKEKCNITDFILDTLGVDGDNTKKVRIGVACDSDGGIIMKYLDGYRFNGHVIRIVPIGKPANNMSQVNTSNESNYQWRSNEQPAQFNYDNSMPPAQNQPGAWPMRQSNTQWTNNQIIPQQIPSQNNFGYVQPVLAAQQPFYHEGRRMQETFSPNVPVIEPPRGNPSRPNVLTNVMVTDQQSNRQPVQGGRYPNQSYPDKSQTIMKDHFQGPSYMSPQTILPDKGHYQGQEWPAQGRQEKIERFQKHPSQFENPDDKIIQPDKRQVMLHNEERNTDGNQYEKGLRRFSPTRDHRLTPDDHKMLPSGRRMSPAARNSQFKNRYSPIGRNVPSDRRISPSARQIPEPGRRMSPPERQFSPSGRQLPQSERQNVQPGRRISPSGRRFSPPGRQISSPGRHLQSGRAISPPGRRMSPPARRMSPPGRRMSPPGRRISPTGGRISPPGRRISPPGRRISPSGPHGRPITPSGRRISPSRRHFSPSGRSISPSRRRITPDRSFLPSGRRVSPGHGISPGGRRMSPVHRPSPTERRLSPGHRMAPMNKGHMVPSSSPGVALNRKISPGRHVSPNRGPPRTYNRYSPPRKSGDNLRPGSSKDVGPSYAVSQAQNQAMYSGYLPDSRDIEQYPPASSRKSDHRPIWQEREKPYQPLASSVDDRRDGMQKYESRRVGDYSRANQPENKILSPSRTSRSPNRRDRSPVRDRYRRHSPSPRSPRRSWALEKRRSPDNIEAPPPPCWPDRHDNVYIKQNRQNDERSSKKPVWEKPETGQKPEGNSTFFRKEDRRSYDSDDRKYFQSSTRTRWESRQSKEREEFRDRSPHRSRPSERYTHNKNESDLPREHYDNKPRNEFQRQYSRNQEPHKDRYEARNRNEDDFDGYRHKKDDYHQSYDDREELYMGRDNLDRKIEDVYKRAEELTRKSEEYQRKRSEKTRFSDDRNRRTDDDSFINRSGGSSRQDFYESSKSRYDENPRDVDEIRNIDLAPKVQYKRDKAVHEISSKTLMKFAPDLTGKRREEVEELLKITIEDMIFEMFGEKDVSFIELVIKFEERYGNEDMEKIFDNVMSKFPIDVRVMKRSARDVSSSPAKIPRSSSRGSIRGGKVKPKTIREATMSKAVAGKKAIAVNRHGLVKKTMIKNEANEVNAPMKKKIPAKKTTPTKLPVAKDTKDNAAVIITKPVLETVPGDKFNPETKAVAIKQEEGVMIKAPEITKSKSEVTKNIDVKKSLSSSVEGQDQVVVKEEKVEDSKEQASTNEYQELNPLLSCSLNSELEEIMIKVWQELPDLPSSKEEELVIEKLRNEAGDDLRNVIGLNITKRLLNMHDSLYAKLYFKTRPERGTLVQFIKKYNLKSFKRIRDDAPVFAAQFNNTDDFDRICNDEEVYCGQVKVQVRPCYNFKTCPPNLRSIFTDKNVENKTNNDRAEGSVDKLKRQQPKTKESLENKECEKKQDDTNNKETTKESEIKTSKENSNTNKEDSVDRIVVKLEKGVNNIEKEKDDGSIKKDDKLNESQRESNSQKDIENDKTDKNNIETKEIVVKKEIEEIEKVESKVKDKDTKEGKENDDIEVQDVQALILEGIILDECTGSDAE